MRLLYVMDPMCGWCYGFQPELDAFLATHPSAQIDWIVGGLAPDTDIPMDESLKQTIASYWHQIEARTQVSFNHDFWTLNTPYRSTYPACRAVIAGSALIENGAEAMTKAIQSAYYQQAKNPSLESTLIECASSIGLAKEQFVAAFKSEQTLQQFRQHLQLSQQLQVSGFPALFYLDADNRAHPLTMGYCQTADLELRLNQLTRG